jgi:hypothetical protein
MEYGLVGFYAGIADYAVGYDTDPGSNSVS